ncbi:hypothetical protein FOL47_002272 [Perkinsus chesapeaki]|uniref:FAD-binding PCMH-type domain-containing protein n=1 Tax=Perkinsus chesapeaki TaxID=330153 RepID=A0A7J6MGD0_PERCH|nr:hypothetical protein FOL47_002272 [Perkinsus chesapeaki]
MQQRAWAHFHRKLFRLAVMILNYSIFLFATRYLAYGCLAYGRDPLAEAIAELQKELPENATITKGIPDPFFNIFGSSYNITPAAMVIPENATQVVSALTICHKYNVPVAVRSGAGHSYIGQSTINNSIVLSLQLLKDFKVDLVDNEYIAKLGGGLDLLEVYTFMAYHDPPLGFAGGFSPSTGIGGFISGGGHGTMSSKYGIAVDRTIAADVVIFDNSIEAFKVVHATTTNEYADLMFAIRGGMGGNYGVVTNFYYKAFIANKVLYSSGSLDHCVLSEYVRHAKAFADFMQSGTTPSEFSARLILGYWAQSPPECVHVYTSLCFCDDTSGDCSRCRNITEKFRRRTGIINSTGVFPDMKEMSLVEAQWSDIWGCASTFPPAGIPATPPEDTEKAAAACRAIEAHGTRWMAAHYYYPAVLGTQAMTKIVDPIFTPSCASSGCFIYVLPYRREMLKEPSDCSPTEKCTAFDHRQQGFSIEHGIQLQTGEDPSKTARPWLGEFSSAIEPYTTNTKYQNYLEDTMTREEWIPRYFPHVGTYKRLQDVKCKYNAIDMFDFSRISNFTIRCSSTS